MMQVRLELAASRSRVKHSTTELLHFLFFCYNYYFDLKFDLIFDMGLKKISRRQKKKHARLPSKQIVQRKQEQGIS